MIPYLLTIRSKTREASTISEEMHTKFLLNQSAHCMNRRRKCFRKETTRLFIDFDYTYSCNRGHCKQFYQVINTTIVRLIQRSPTHEFNPSSASMILPSYIGHGQLYAISGTIERWDYDCHYDTGTNETQNPPKKSSK